MTEQDIVKQCLIGIFKKNGYQKLDGLTQRDFDHVGNEIERFTGISISGSTIKRLLSGQFSRLPQIATLDAISKYSGFKNWQEYKSALKQGENDKLSENAFEDPKIEKIKKAKPENKTLKLALTGLIVTAIGILAFMQLSRRSAHFEKASFSMRKTTADNIPNTVIFQYNVDDVVADSFFIQQSWDSSKRVRIFKNNYTLTDIYFEPGYHIAKLIANDSVIKAIDVSIPTDRWFLFAKDNLSGMPQYITTSNAHSGVDFGITAKDLTDNKIDITKEKFYVSTFFPGKIDVSSDNFTLKTRVKIKEVRKNFCPYVALEIFTQRYPMFFTITPKGCVSEAMVQFGEKFISGKETDLASLGFDVKQWMDIELIVKNRHARITLNNKEIFTITYKNTSKLIAGLGFMSNGLCEIEFVELKGLDGKVVYRDGLTDEP
ncbi:hypothetical protein [Dyadobacter arcticus]|uniref:Uncharacterized protein n=1 Tax=Dyadobacter arcticus TaxID=1078754 RepID=A0ABX0URP4_9BACT|nr:hypothetical protein [Dyadobacter arcticus]NIJ54390.1 hypothetical protein [Dyadobacter arcticus]